METTPDANEIEALLAETDWVSRLALGLTRDLHGAEDLAQETWLAALARWRRPSVGDASPRPWLAGTARRRVLHERRGEAARRGREADRARATSGRSSPAPEELLGRLETQEALGRLVRELPGELSEVLLLHFYEGRSLVWIARELGIPAGTVRWRKLRALELLREKLDTAHAGDRGAWLSVLAPLADRAIRTGVVSKAGGAWLSLSLPTKLAALLAVSFTVLVPVLRSGVEDAGRLIGPVLAPVDLEGSGDAAIAREPQTAEGDRHGTHSSRAVASRENAPRLAASGARASSEDGDESLVTRIRLTVVDSAGRPVEGASAFPDFTLEQSRALSTFSGLDEVGLSLDWLDVTDGDGELVLETRRLPDLRRRVSTRRVPILEPGYLRVEFEIEGPRFEVGTLIVDVVPGMDEDLGDFVLEPAGAVAGLLRGFAGDPGSSKTLLIWPMEHDEHRTRAASERDRPEGVVEGWTGLEGDGSFLVPGIPPGEYRAFASTSERSQHDNPSKWSGWSEPFSVTPGVLTGNITIEMERESLESFVLLVQDADGEPLPTASFAFGRGPELRWLPVAAVYGSFGITFSGEIPGQWSERLTVRDNSLVHAPRIVESPALVGELVVRLQRAETLLRVLRLRGPGGASVGAAEVRVDSLLGERTWRTERGAVELRLPAAVEGPFDLVVRAPGYQSVQLNELVAEELAIEDGAWVLELEQLSGLRGLVRRRGRPLEGARVELRKQVRAGYALAGGTVIDRIHAAAVDGVEAQRTGRDGSFLLQADLDGELALVVTHPDAADAVVLLDGYLAATGWPELVVELGAGGVVRGIVRDHGGEPVHGADVMLDHPLHAARSTLSGADGSFHFETVSAGDWNLHVGELGRYRGRAWMMQVQVPEGWVFPANCRVTAGAELAQDLVLPDPAGTSIAGRIRVRDAEPAVADIVAHHELSGLGRLAPQAKRFEFRGASDVDGNFELRLPQGHDFSILLAAAGLAGRFGRVVTETELPAWFELELATAGLVFLREGALPEEQRDRDVTVRWSDGGWNYAEFLRPDANGELAPARVPVGDLRLEWKGAAGEPRSREIRIAEGEERVVTLD